MYHGSQSSGPIAKSSTCISRTVGIRNWTLFSSWRKSYILGILTLAIFSPTVISIMRQRQAFDVQIVGFSDFVQFLNLQLGFMWGGSVSVCQYVSEIPLKLCQMWPKIQAFMRFFMIYTLFCWNSLMPDLDPYIYM